MIEGSSGRSKTLCKVGWGVGGVSKRGLWTERCGAPLSPLSLFTRLNIINHKLVSSTQVLYIWTEVKLCNVCVLNLWIEKTETKTLEH